MSAITASFSGSPMPGSLVQSDFRTVRVRARSGRIDLFDRIDDEGREERHIGTGLGGPGDFHHGRRTAEHATH
jgi:hypothetical protein